MCGSSKQQNSINDAQTEFYKQLTSQYQTDFAQNQDVLKQLTSTLSPIIAAGAGQEGYTPEQKAALNAQATEGSAQAYRQAATAANEGMAARGGGNIPITGPATEQLSDQLKLGAETNLNNEKLGITTNNFALGRQNFNTAVGQLASVPGALEGATNGAAGAATSAGTAAATEANEINKSNNSWMGLVGGLIGTATSFIPGVGAAKAASSLGSWGDQDVG